MKQAVILAGGQGRRLQERLGNLPKPMIPIGGRPLLEHQIELARRHGFTRILIFAHHRADVIQNHFGDGRRWNVQINYVLEREPLGTAGAVLRGRDHLADEFLVIYGDTMLNVDLARLWQAHQARAADATLFLHPNNHPLDSDLVETDDGGWVSAFHGRPHPPHRFFQNLVNAGLYVVRKSSLTDESHSTGILDFGKDLFPKLLKRGLRLFGYNSPEYIKDIGTPARYDRVCAEFDSGLIARSSLETQQPAVFLDRDGTVIKERDGLTSPDQVELLPDAAEAVRKLNHAGRRVVLVTNQPVVAKGFCTENDVRFVHNKLETLLGHEHAFLDRIYYCPHHPEKGFTGERADLKIACRCRKPEPGMVLQAAGDLNIDLQNSWLIGDTTTDIQTARNAGVRAILVRTGHKGEDRKFPSRPDYAFDTLLEAASFVAGQDRA